MMKKYILRVAAMVMAIALLMTSNGFALTLRYPQRGDDVASLQRALKQLGYYTKNIDGEYGSGTRSAVRTFQKAYGLSVDGVAGPKTIDKLEKLTGIQIDGSNGSGSTDGEDAPSAAGGLFGGVYTTIQFGDKGDRVKILQRALQTLGFVIGKVDGDFGSGTYVAVKEFQKSQRLTVDGKAGKNTLKKLESFFDKAGNLITGPIVPQPPADEEDDPAYDVPTRTLRYGMAGSDVEFTQQRLYTLGYYTGARDGKFGSGMLSAVKAFQKKNGLSADGVVGAATIKALFSTAAIPEDDMNTPDDKPENDPKPSATPSRTLRYGNTGEDVKLVQKRLIELGYLTGTATGTYASATLSAVKAFQKANGLTVDGVAGANTYKKLFSDNAISAGSKPTDAPEETPDEKPTPTPSATPSRTLRYGDIGEDVKLVQKRLIELGYLTGTATGTYASATLSAVKAFQKANGLTVDGVAGANTYKKLFSDDAISADRAPADLPTEDPTPTPTPTPTPIPTPETTPSRTLRYGDTGEDVKLVQNRLISLGYLAGAANGTYGDATLSAVKAFQKVNGLTADGVAGTKTYKKLFSNSAVEADPDDVTIIPQRSLTIGDTGDDVKSVQKRLRQLGYYSGTADGTYGSATTSAMLAFQRMNGLNGTGNGNMATYARLFSDDALTDEGVKLGESSPGYTNLRLGATGTAVTRLQQKLDELKYDVTVNGTYDEQTYNAVLAFQKLNGLSADGVAGKVTQTKLYSGNCVTGDNAVPGDVEVPNVPTGNGGGPNVSQVKWLMWYDEIKPQLGGSDILLVYEPSTNTSYRIRVFARGRHLDAEPYTLEDTALMKAAWGGKFSWNEKPVYVRLPSGVWCIASTHSMPHEENGLVSNGFYGHLCVHFPRTLEETIASGDDKNGVRHQNDIRKHWLKISGENITW